MKKQILVMSGIFVAIIVLALVLFSTSEKPLPQTLGTDIKGEQLIVRPQSHQLGSETAKVTLVEFADFQCPVCATAQPQIQQLEEKYGQDPNFRFVYRYFPLISIHKNAMISSQAAEAASIQNKFWEMNAILYVNQNSWAYDVNPTDKFMSYARDIGLDVDKFKSDMLSQDVINTVTQDLRDAEALGLNSTPTFYINNQKITGIPPDLNALIEQELAK